MNRRNSRAFFLAVLALCLNLNPQEQSKELANRLFIVRLGNMMMESKIAWDKITMEIELGRKESTKTVQDVIAYLDSIQGEEGNLIIKYRNQIRQLLNALDAMSGRTPFYFESAAVKSLHYKDGNCIIINLALDIVYNTIRTTSNSRFAEVLRACIIPHLSHFSKEFKSEEIINFGIIITYGSRNILGKTGYPELKAESGCIIINKNDCRKFTDGEITENELLANSSVYLSDRDMIGGIKKVDIKID